jgi:hypothetical protein
MPQLINPHLHLIIVTRNLLKHLKQKNIFSPDNATTASDNSSHDQSTSSYQSGAPSVSSSSSYLNLEVTAQFF